MKSKKYWLVSIVLAVLIVFSAACQSAAPAPAEEAVPAESEAEAPSEAEPAAEAEDDGIQVALVLSGPISDASWNAAAYNAITSLEDKFNISLQYTENVGLPDIEPTYRDYASKGFDVIIGHGFQYGDPAVSIGQDYPDTKWGIVMGIVDAPNVVSLNFREEETAYLAGYLAASISESGVIGGIGGEEIPSIIKTMEAYKLGAKTKKPDIKVLVTYTGTWVDPTAGYEAASAQMNNGADVLYPAANLTSTGVYQAAQEKGVAAIGSEGNQCDVAPGTIKASSVDNIDRLLELMLEDIGAGTFQGAVKYYGLNEGAISFVSCGGQIPADVEQEVRGIEQQIISGELEVPVILEPTE